MTTSTATLDASNATPPLIVLDDVSRRFVGRRGEPVVDAVRPTSLRIERSEVFGLIGTSGAGKSTLLRLINLLETPDSGRVVVAGRELTALSRRQLRAARRGIGMIFQQFNLLSNANVFDNVAFPLTIQSPRPARDVIAARVAECLAIVGLTDKLAAYPAQLSGGQRQRVAIARALASRPDVLLCDEPTSALDSETTKSILETLADINRRLGVTIVIVTHELAIARALCSRVAVMADGRIVETIPLDPATGAGFDRLETAIARTLQGAPADEAPVQEPVGESAADTRPIPGFEGLLVPPHALRGVSHA